MSPELRNASYRLHAHVESFRGRVMSRAMEIRAAPYEQIVAEEVTVLTAALSEISKQTGIPALMLVGLELLRVRT